ncbi:MAG: hypothetical protein IPP49_15600 [Saprospiraceae bacterium]|nr:hypothetical protein [Saprospiraceae bacterium]
MLLRQYNYLGTHVAVYTAYDACYNKSTASIVVEVEDNTPPVAICDEFATLDLHLTGLHGFLLLSLMTEVMMSARWQNYL